MKYEFEKLEKGFKKKWTAALRSGKFKQGRGKLLSEYEEGDNRYCCLGVAGEICGLKNMDGIGTIEKSAGLKGISKVPKQLIGNMKDNKLVDILATKNDSGKWSFKKIATWIEKHL